MRRFVRWASGLHVGQLAMVSAVLLFLSWFFITWSINSFEVALGCPGSDSGCVGFRLWMAGNFLVGVTFGFMAIAAWWTWFGARKGA